MSRLLRALRLAVNGPKRVLAACCTRLPAFRFVHETRDTQTPVTFDMWWRQEVRGHNRGPYWPVHPTSLVTGWRNVIAGVETSPGYMPGCYIQALGRIEIGDYTQIGPNVGLISANHARHDLREHEPGEIRIGRYCWLGMGSVVLPGVTLGDFTIVGAGAIVSRSFPDGYCVIAGNPAREVRKLDRSICIEHKSRHEYHGFIPKAEFAEFRARQLVAGSQP
jgi:acetyltransferase-like isoleucine patch superfamily enzyme